MQSRHSVPQRIVHRQDGNAVHDELSGTFPGHHCAPSLPVQREPRGSGDVVSAATRYEGRYFKTFTGDSPFPPPHAASSRSEGLASRFGADQPGGRCSRNHATVSCITSPKAGSA